jgi:thioredoxin-related protein
LNTFRLAFVSCWILVGLVVASPVIASEKVEWNTFDQGLKAVAEKKKYVFLDFYADWCTFCHLLHNTTLKSPKVVKELNKSFISIKLDTESKDTITWQGKKTTGRDFTASLGIISLPTLLFLNHKLEIIGSYPNYADEIMMLNLLTYVSSGSRERNESFEEYLRQQDK